MEPGLDPRADNGRMRWSAFRAGGADPDRVRASVDKRVPDLTVHVPPPDLDPGGRPGRLTLNLEVDEGGWPTLPANHPACVTPDATCSPFTIPSNTPG
jgi:hypothetical protein